MCFCNRMLVVISLCWLEQPTVNYNSYPWLIVSKHVEYPKKRSFSSCTTVNHAMMYIYYAWSSKASWMSITQVPFITRTIQAHRILKSWVETQATTTRRYSLTPNKSHIYNRDIQLDTENNLWHEPYLALDDTDANDWSHYDLFWQTIWFC